MQNKHQLEWARAFLETPPADTYPGWDELYDLADAIIADAEAADE